MVSCVMSFSGVVNIRTPEPSRFINTLAAARSFARAHASSALAVMWEPSIPSKFKPIKIDLRSNSCWSW